MSEPKTIKINEVEYVRKDEAEVKYVARKEGPWEIGKSYLIRTVTMIQHGVLVEVTEHELVLMNASWIADTGRFSDFVNGKVEPNEVEPFPINCPVIVGRGSLIDACRMNGAFRNQK
jgi:hypothetical protein